MTENRMEDLSIFDMTADTPVDTPVHVNHYMSCLCMDGKADIHSNLSLRVLEKHAFFIITPGQLLEKVSMSPDFKGICSIMSQEFVSSMNLPYNFNTYMSVNKNPVISLTERQFNAILQYFSMLRNVLTHNHPYGMEIIRHLTCAFFYGFGYYVHHVGEMRNAACTRDEKIMQGFLAEVRLNCHKERKVAFYAERLNLTASYLSSVVKKVSGKTPSDYIEDFVILNAKIMLRSGKMTVQQVSNELDFPSQSFFGKFFKRKTGMSPKEYRKGEKMKSAIG